MQGKLNLIIGPMFSGKSTLLLSRYRRYKIAGKNCLLIKYAKDDRYDSNEATIVTHDKISYRAIACLRLADLDQYINDFDVICIDEIQFYPDAAIYCDKWANRGKIIEVSGLSGDYKRKPFEQISLLIPLADDIEHVKAVCRASGLDAPFSKRISKEEEQEVIGGEDKYMAVSRGIFFDKHLGDNNIY
jgi:thymidine kinase